MGDDSLSMHTQIVYSNVNSCLWRAAECLSVIHTATPLCFYCFYVHAFITHSLSIIRDLSETFSNGCNCMLIKIQNLLCFWRKLILVLLFKLQVYYRKYRSLFKKEETYSYKLDALIFVSFNKLISGIDLGKLMILNFKIFL